MSRLPILREQLATTRAYTNRVLTHIDQERWWEMPSGQVTHIGWLVGHLAWAQQVHLLERVCGLTAGDPALLPMEYWTLFGKDSVPMVDRWQYPATGEIRRQFDRIFMVTMKSLELLAESDLDHPLPVPHWAAKTKFDMIVWNIKHEMLHTGQIGLCRRLLGLPPFR